VESVTAKHNSRRGGKRMIAAVDIGGTKIAVGMVDSKGHLVSRAELPTAADAGYSSALNRIATIRSGNHWYRHRLYGARGSGYR